MKDIRNEQIDALIEVLEEGARASREVIDVFVEPVEGTLRRAKTKRHQLIFGRRGSGKSSLLIKSAQDLVQQKNPSVYVDLEPFKEQDYPNIIISVLLTVAVKLNSFFNNVPSDGLSDRKWFELWKPKLNRKGKLYYKAKNDLEIFIKELESFLYGGDEVKFSEKKSSKSRKIFDVKGKFSLGSLFGKNNSVESSVATTIDQSKASDTSIEFTKTKVQYLTNGILSFRSIMEGISVALESPVFILFDDLYHIRKSEQAKLIDYFHRIVKGNNAFLKIGTIKTRSNWYDHVPQPMGLKIGDDADEINLDQTLERFFSTKAFLKDVLRQYNLRANNTDNVDFISETGLDRLVLASGGVARDFLGLFRRSISSGRERLRKKPNHMRGTKLSAEDVNVAAGAYGDTKREEFQRDTLEDTKKLEDAFNKVRKFCLEVIKKNVFLVDQDTSGEGVQLLNELIDLRLIHQIASRVTVTDKAGSINRAYLLDVSQYTGERLRRDVNMIDFWKEKSKDRIRLKTMIYDPNWSMAELEEMAKGIDEKSKGRNRKGQFLKKKESNSKNVDEDTNPTLFD